MNVAKKSLGTILSQAMELCQKLMPAIAAGAVIFGLLNGGINYWTTKPLLDKSEQIARQAQDINTATQNAVDRLNQGDQNVMDDLDDTIQALRDKVPPAPTGVDPLGIEQGIFAGALWTLLIGGLLSMVLSLVSQAYLTFVVVRQVSDPSIAAEGMMKHVGSLFLLWAWMGLRSCIWIPIIGLIPAIILGPRMVASPIYLLEQNKGITESVRLSINVTKGSWGRIVWPAFVAGLLAAIASGIIGAVLSIGGPLVSVLARSILSIFVAAYTIAVGIIIARDVMAHPSHTA